MAHSDPGPADGAGSLAPDAFARPEASLRRGGLRFEPELILSAIPIGDDANPESGAARMAGQPETVVVLRHVVY
jgi:hypothetical protein